MISSKRVLTDRDRQHYSPSIECLDYEHYNEGCNLMINNKPVKWAINHMVAPQLSIEAFISLAVKLGAPAVELRNDIGDEAAIGSMVARDVKAIAEAANVRILTINALYPFNDWCEERVEQATKLAEYAADCGCEALVLVPQCDGKNIGEIRHEKLREALMGLAPILQNAGLMGFVEPLGFPQCSLRFKSEAVAAITELGLSSQFKLVHDTFHHVLAGEETFFAAETGLIHISGVEDAQVKVADMLDAHRVLVGLNDRLENVSQISALLSSGADVHCAFEPFAQSVHQEKDIAKSISQSIEFIQQNLKTMAA